MGRPDCRWIWGMLVSSVLVAAPARAGDAGGETAPDKPVRVEKGLFHAPVRLEAAGGVIDHGPAWGHAGPWVVDVDGDGVKDLVVGDFSGFFTVYRNTGTDAKPVYAEGVKLKAGGVDAQVPIY